MKQAGDVAEDESRVRRVAWLRWTTERLRLKCGNSGTVAAKAIGVSRQSYHQLEHGDVDPGISYFRTIARLCYALGISLDEAAKEMGVIPQDDQMDDPIESTISELLEDTMNAVKRISVYLQRVLAEKGLNWKTERELKEFAYGPGKPGTPNNVWSETELPRLYDLINGEVENLKSSDCACLAACLSCLENRKITPEDVVNLSKQDQNPGNRSHLEDRRKSACSD